MLRKKLPPKNGRARLWLTLRLRPSHRKKCSRCVCSCPIPLLEILSPPPTPHTHPVPLHLPPTHAGVHWRPLERPGYFGHWCARGGGVNSASPEGAAPPDPRRASPRCGKGRMRGRPLALRHMSPADRHEALERELSRASAAWRPWPADTATWVVKSGGGSRYCGSSAVCWHRSCAAF
jgi:hypothetical protein